ncbi:MAG TPA: NAD-dependent epimerase/dehydratase family protein, partial [Acidobacteriota bacterium]|nr:NAD-dependent epimerase/dehydratase family protein [Acidobacteriota bacterium]
MLALVTGGCGFIGSHIVERLVREGYTVRVLDDLSSGKRENISHLSSGVELTVGDIRDAGVLGKVLEGVEVVFHEAAFVSVPESERDPSNCFDINVGGTILLLKESERCGVRRLIFASSCAVYGNSPDLPLTEDVIVTPGSPYALSKSVAEQIMREFCFRRQIGITALRYFNVYGPRQNPESKYAAVVSKFIEDGTRRKKLVVEG